MAKFIVLNFIGIFIKTLLMKMKHQAYFFLLGALDKIVVGKYDTKEMNPMDYKKNVEDQSCKMWQAQ